ncbi:hypothetical protein ONZ45_g1367 [Pleurotus djamor]|nr:hypothetical protein ONZ45_g12577 [Pleurotus djamor]KAJ8522017.1 hypothetical protein ONZ45_g1367 [Pleurotus djamor]
MSTFVIPEGSEYVAAGFLSTVWLLAYQTSTVSKYRKAAGIKYPQAYAEKAEVDASLAAKQFNCAQRAHQNTLESVPILYVTALISSLKFPIPTAVVLGLWSFSRVLYTRGYVSGDPAKRNARGGWISSVSLAGLVLTSTYTVGKSLVEKLL